MRESSFGFQWTFTTLAISVAALLVVCALSWINWRRSGFRTAVGALETLRVCIVGLALLLLNQPEAVEQFKPNDKPTLVVLADQSRSMLTRDIDSPDQSELKVRRELVDPLLDADNWAPLSGKLDVVLSPFSSGEASSKSDLDVALRDARKNHPNLRAVVLASDGDWNSGKPPVEAALQMRLEKIPVFSVPIGSESRLPDLEVLSFDVPTFGVAGKNVRIPFTIDSSLPVDHVAQVELRVSDGTKIQHQVQVSAMGRTSDAILWKPEGTGDFTLSLELPPHPREKIQDNNTREAPIAIREEKLRVLVIESVPRWEYRYLRNALSRDPGVEVSCLLFHPGLSKVGGGNRDYIPGFPEEMKDLAEYDVVFLGDVGLGEKQLSEEQCRLLKGLVEQQASGLVFMPGFRGNMLNLAESELAPLIPVVFDHAQPQGVGMATPSHFALTELGRRSLLTKLADTQDENIQVWERLPGFQWHAPVVRAKAGTDVLAVHQESSNEFGRLPLLVTRTFGAGKVLFMGTDGAWRWRRGVEDLYHYRFWGQVVRWMAYQRNMAEGERMRLFYSPEQPQVRQTLSMSVNVMESSGEPLSEGQVSVRIAAPSGRTETVELTNSDAEWGLFNGVFTPVEPGKHQVVVRCVDTNSQMKTTLFVQGNELEQMGKPARPEVMEELARVSRGQILDAENLEGIMQAIADLPEPEPKIRRLQLWSHPLAAMTLIALLGVFWVGRKMVGLV